MDLSSVSPCLKHLNFNFLYFLFANVFHSNSHPKVTTCCKITAFHDFGTPTWFSCIPFHSAFNVFKTSEETERTLPLFFSFTSFFLNSSPQLQLQKAAVNQGVCCPALHPTIYWGFHCCLHPLVRSLTGISQNCFHRCEGAVVLEHRVLRHCTAVVQVRTLYPRKPNSPQYLSGKHMHFNDFEGTLPII